MKILISALVLAFLCSAAVYAGNPPPLFDKPVKLDDSGRPLYNSFERYEYERKLRLKRKTQSHNQQYVTPTETPSATKAAGVNSQGHSDKTSGSIPQNGTIKNSATSAPTPSSVIINRPVHIKGDPTTDDFQF